MFLTHALLTAVCIPLASAAAIEPRSPLPPIASRPLSPSKRDNRVPPNQVIHIDIALSLEEEASENAAKALESISDPNSDKFGQYLKPAEAAELFTPPVERVREVARWLNDSGVARSRMRLSLDLAHIGFDVPAEEAEALFEAEFHTFSSGDGVDVASEKYTVPSRLSEYIDFVAPTANGGSASAAVPDSVEVELPDEASLQARQAADIDCFQYMTPHCLRKLYNIDDGEDVTPHPDNSFGFFTPSFSTWLSDDMEAFFTRLEPRLTGEEPIVMPINGGYRYFDSDLINFNLEPHLDYQYGMAIAYPQPVVNIQVGDMYQVGNLNTMLAAFDKDYCTFLDPEFDPIYPSEGEGGYNSSDCGTHTPPRVIGIAYAWNEAQFSEAYLKRQCLEFLKLGLQGVTVLTGSADRGTADQLGTCVDPETGEEGAQEGHFSAVFPSSCPWVTSVGATQLKPTGDETWDEDTPFPGEESLDFNGTTSGGGFSRAFPAPWYQSAQTAEYLDKSENAQELGESGYFDVEGRGYPDIAALGLNYLIRTNGAFRAVRGTSASVPLVAGMIAKINQARLEAGKGTVGFVNPVMYALGGKAMRDVTVGANRGCGVEEAFEAAEGWDAVTGLGSPDYAKLLDLYMALP